MALNELGRGGASVVEGIVEGHGDGVDVVGGGPEGLGGKADLLDEIRDLRVVKVHVLVDVVLTWLASI